MSLQIFFLLLISLPFFTHANIFTELISLRLKSESSVIYLDDFLLSKILSLPSPRPFSLFIFFYAENMHSNSELKLKHLKNEFDLVSKSYLLNKNEENENLEGKNGEKDEKSRKNDEKEKGQNFDEKRQNLDGKSGNFDEKSGKDKNFDKKSNEKQIADDIFFFYTEYLKSKRVFEKFGINTLPHIRLVLNTATLSNLKTESEKMVSTESSAETMAEFVESRVKIKIGKLHRPPFFSKVQIGVMMVFSVFSVPFLVKKVILGDSFLKSKKLWLIGAIFVYFFSVSGGMFNIIQNMPMFMGDRDDPDKIVFFYKGSGMQLGVEGFSVGGLYTIVGILLAFVTHVLVKVKDVNVQRTVLILALLVSFWAVKKVVFLDNWKTGYAIHMYWPSGW